MNMFESSLIKQQFNDDGFAIIQNFFDRSIIDELKIETEKLVSQFENDEKSGLYIFTAGTEMKSDQYFLESGDKIRYFLEKDAFDYDGNLVVNIKHSLNKIGHALHWLNPVFRRFTFNEKFKQLAMAIGLKDPVIVQSMIIFKNPKIGGEVVEHQDASYLHTFPKPNGSVIGFWIPFEDATEQNGCLEFIPGSHQTIPLSSRWIRSKNPINGSIQMKHTNPDVKYVGQFIPAPAKSGSCVVIDGMVVHRSAPNHSDLPRPIYTFHMFDRAKFDDSRWDENNWLQPTDELPFPSLYDN